MDKKEQAVLSGHITANGLKTPRDDGSAPLVYYCRFATAVPVCMKQIKNKIKRCYVIRREDLSQLSSVLPFILRKLHLSLTTHFPCYSPCCFAYTSINNNEKIYFQQGTD